MNEKKAALNKIRQTWHKVAYIINNQDWTPYADLYIQLNKKETKQHLNFKPEGVSHGMTITQEAQFFAVQQLAQYLYNLKEAPKAEDYLFLRKSLYLAYGIVNRFGDKLKDVITLEEAQYFNKLDYCEMVKAEDYSQ